MGLGRPIVEGADDRHPLGMRGPHPEGGPPGVGDRPHAGVGGRRGRGLRASMAARSVPRRRARQAAASPGARRRATLGAMPYRLPRIPTVVGDCRFESALMSNRWRLLQDRKVLAELQRVPSRHISLLRYPGQRRDRVAPRRLGHGGGDARRHRGGPGGAPLLVGAALAAERPGVRLRPDQRPPAPRAGRCASAPSRWAGSPARRSPTTAWRCTPTWPCRWCPWPSPGTCWPGPGRRPPPPAPWCRQRAPAPYRVARPGG